MPTQNKKESPKNTERSNDSALRVPRPKGLTRQLQLERTNNNGIDKKKLIRELIKRYARQGYTYMGETMDIESFAEAIGTPQTNVLKNLNRGFDGMMTPEALKSISANLILTCLSSGHGAATKAEVQLNKMVLSQGKGYKPFVSAAVNDAIRGTQSALKVQIDLIKMLNDMATNEALMSGTQLPNGQALLGTDEALKLIRSEVPLSLPNRPEQLYLLHQNNHIGSGPNINAVTQDGTELIPYAQEVPNTLGSEVPNDDRPGTLKPNEKKAKHEDRRAREIGLIDEEELMDSEALHHR